MAKKVKERDDGNKLKPFIYEMKVEGIMDNKEMWNEHRLFRIFGLILVSNFLNEGERIAPPLIAKSLRKRLHVDDRIRITMYGKKSEIKRNEDGNPCFPVSGHKYELWDDTSDSWTCVYENYEGDKQDP